MLTFSELLTTPQKLSRAVKYYTTTYACVNVELKNSIFGVV